LELKKKFRKIMYSFMNNAIFIREKHKRIFSKYFRTIYYYTFYKRELK